MVGDRAYVDALIQANDFDTSRGPDYPENLTVLIGYRRTLDGEAPLP